MGWASLRRPGSARSLLVAGLGLGIAGWLWLALRSAWRPATILDGLSTLNTPGKLSAGQAYFAGAGAGAGAGADAGADAASPLHPIHWLLGNASAAWSSKLAAQSATLAQAVGQYRRRHRRNPPAGFEEWFNWSVAHRVRLIDEFDSIHAAIQPFVALDPALFRQRAADLVNGRTKWANLIFVVSIRAGTLSLSGHRAALGPRPLEVLNLLKPISHLLPDIDLPITDQDIPVINVSAESRDIHVQAAQKSQFLTQAEADNVHSQPGLHGWPNTCPADSLLRRQLDGLATPSSSSFSQSYIYDHLLSTNICQHPELQHQNGFLSTARPRVYPFYPLFAFTKYHGFSELAITPTSQYSLEVGNDPEWELKESRLNWRGRNTGIVFNSENNWRQSQRTRLVKFANEARGTVKVRKTNSDESLDFFEGDTKMMNEQYFDIAFSGSPHQCDKNDGTCDAIKKLYTYKEKLTPDQTNQFKYVIDVDGNGWSGRFHRLMSTKSAILKSTIFPEWYFDRIQPWLHYIPVRVDYQDLYDIMAFFVGGPNGENNHDSLAKEIGQAGSDWAKEYWRTEDMQSYMYRLILEYSRLLRRTRENPELMDYK